MKTTRFSKSGQPVMNTVMEVEMQEGPWQVVTIVGKLYGPAGNADLRGVIVEGEDADGRWRERLPWPCRGLRPVTGSLKP